MDCTFYSDEEFEYFRTVLKKPRKTIGGKVEEKKRRVLEFPSEKVHLTDRCLIIDKNKHEAELVKRSLEKYGFLAENILIETTGSKGLHTFLNTSRVKIVVTDIHVAEMNGLEIIKAIRTNHLFSQVHLVVLSEKVSKQVVEYASFYKSFVVAKPFNEDRFFQWLGGVCVSAEEEIVISSPSLISGATVVSTQKSQEENTSLEARVSTLEELLKKALEEIEVLKERL